ncbi:MAG: hypothetical protein QOE14_976 [Humisphaera sp.]|nr:hypothetical protein [Humisphaera sp.]
MKIQVEQLDLLAPWPAITMRAGYYAVRVTVRLGAIPIGGVFVRPVRTRVVRHDRLRRRIARECGSAIAKLLGIAAVREVEEVLLSSGVPEPIRGAFVEAHSQRSWPTPGVTVAIYTRDRADVLEACVRSLQQLDYPNFDILVLDNSHDPVPTRERAEKLGVGYVRCLASSAGRARNAAVEQSRSEWIAFLDDDCRPERNWLKELVRAAQDADCRCVCGPVRPAKLESSADIAFAMHGGFPNGFTHRVLTPASLDCSLTRPAPAWRFGSTANLLVHRVFVQLAGGFDVDLANGEEADLFYRAILAGHTVHYTPLAIVAHQRAWTRKSLRHWIRASAGAAAIYHVQRVLRYWDYRSLIELAWHRPLALARELASAIRGRSRYPWSLLLVEFRGMIAGPVTHAAMRLRRLGKSNAAKSQARRPNRKTGATPIPSPDPATLAYGAPPRNPSNRAA